MLLKELLFLNIIIITGTTSTHCYGSMHWTWSCINGSCLRSSTPYDKNGTSLNICRMLCGKYGSLWPIPTGKAVLGNGFYYFHSSKIKFDYSKVAGEAAKNYLTKVSTIFQSKLDKTCGDECIFIPRTEINITFNVMLPQMTLNWNTDESYTLDISKSEFSSDGNNIVDVKIKSKSVYGARHALETLTQLTTLYTPFPCNGQTNSTLVIVSSAQLTDSPAYSHRGLVLDTARHYIPVKSIYKTLDAMAMTKLNIFHWHVTDSQSFPLEIPRVPQLLWYGAYSQDLVYTVADTKAIVEYAKLRGIRVILEVDAPAHAGNGWQWGEDYNLGKLALCVNQLPWRKYCIQPPCGQLNPVNVNLFDVLKKMFADIIEMLPSGEAFHMGGDEVFFPCWNSSIEVIHWMENNLLNRTEADFLYLWSLYQNTTLSLFDEINPVTDVPIILWSSKLTDPEVIEQFLDKDRYIIQTWMEASSPIPQKLLDKGYRLILSAKDKWYLDHGFWGRTAYHDWKVMYNYKLYQHENVLGGEVAMWTEKVDHHSLDVKVWPRTAATAERLWSNPKLGANEAEGRFEHFRESLTKIGINADANSPYYCYENENECQ